MKGRDFLFGGNAKGRSSSRRVRKVGSSQDLPPMVGIRFIAIVTVVGMCFALAGFWRINSVFTARDYEIETHRLQELARERRDRETLLLARTSQLQRGEVLRSVAESSLGMAEPAPAEMETLRIPSEVTARWLAAASGVETNSPEKEGH